MRQFVILILLGFLAPSAQKKGIGEFTTEFFNASTKIEQDKMIKSLLNLNPKIEEVRNLLKRGRKYSKDVPLGWNVFENLCIDSIERPYHIYIPEDYDPEKRYIVLFDLHGGVSREELIPEKDFEKRRSFWEDEAKREKFIYILPLGQKGAEWWTEVGAQNILSILKEVKRRYNVNENKVFVSGFSDGGSGSYYMALHHSTPFAGFLPLNGHIGVAQAGGNPVYLPNLSNKPLYIVNTGKDPLYPAKELKPYIEKMKEAGADIIFRVYKDIGHSPDYMDKEKPRMIKFMEKVSRNPFPLKLEWETSSENMGRVHWIRIDKISNVGNNAEFNDYNPIIKTRRVKIGIYVDTEFKGKGVRIKKVVKNTLADSLGLKQGDIIKGLDDKEVKNLKDLRGILLKKRPGDSIRIAILRNGKEFLFKGRFKPFKPRPAFEREKLSGRIEAKVKGNRIDVRVKNVAKYTVFISQDMFDLNRDIEIYTNGKLSFKGRVKPDLEFMLRQVAEDMDREMVYDNKIEIKVRGS